MKQYFSGLVLFLFLANTGIAQSNYTFSKTIDSILEKKICYMLYVFDADPVLKNILQKDPVLKKITNDQRLRFKESLHDCKEVTCLSEQLKWTSDEILKIGDRLVWMNNNNKFSGRLIKNLKSEPYYINYQKLADSVLIRKAWTDVASGLNRVLNVYLAGQRPHYAMIDSISFKTNDPQFLSLVYSNFQDIRRNYDKPSDAVFYRLSLQAALKILAINQRNEAARYEPLTGGLNQEVFDHIKNIDWSKYKYSAMLVPGFGPELPGINIDHRSIERCKMALTRYKNGLAPIIIVSGGHVYPLKTPYSEGIEMKKYMVEKLGIPSNAIIVEPHARHTTTNLRNAVRLIYRFGIPDEKPLLTVTDSSQTKMIVTLDERCIRELGYVPYYDVKKLSEEETTVMPLKVAFHANINDPLDP